MSDEVFDSFFRYKIANDICEVSYPFSPSEKLTHVIDSLPKGSILYLKDDDSGNASSVVRLPQEMPGFRVRINDTLLYLLVEQGISKSEERLHKGFDKHARCLSGHQLYFPSQKDILKYWEKPEDIYNPASGYASDELLVRSQYLESLIREYCPDTSSALEIGCNIGRNINHLKTAMDLEVAGCEISEHALSLLRENYPALAQSTLYQGPVQETIKEIKVASYDLVFSMAVLMHLHPLTEKSFWHSLYSLSRKYLITIENEHGGSNRNWRRNYKEIFEPLGAEELYTTDFLNSPPPEKALANYTVRVFWKTT